MRISGIIIAFTLVVISSFQCLAQESLPDRLARWTTSRVNGSPDPPLPYKTMAVYQGVKLDSPTDITWLPDARRWIATQNNGKILKFENDPRNAFAEPLLDLTQIPDRPATQVFATIFHPDLKNQPWCFVTYEAIRNGTKRTFLSRLKVLDPSVPTVDLASLTVVTDWIGGGHSGGAMQFGPDGMLYVTTGDGQAPYPPDESGTGQDRSDLEASVLRIDVDNPTADQPYRIPTDNPFVGQPNTREEIWAFGFRNPWKLAFDPVSGDLIAADVGWEMREMIHRVARGRNHGWSLMEGSQRVKEGQEPKIPITPPLFEHTHLDSRSISGGFFWHSDRLPELKGAYIYGDWMTGKVWALKSDGDRVLWQKELVDTPVQVICFMLDPTGEVLIVGYDGTILRLETNRVKDQSSQFPLRLSETGLFANVVTQEPARGVIPYEISAHRWADGTESNQWVAIPGNQQLQLFDRDDWTTGQTKGRFDFPSDTVMVKTVSYLADPNDAGSRRHLETQLLHLLGDQWKAYNYVWNEEQTDAVLQDDLATERQLEIKDAAQPGGIRKQTWRHSSRSECLLCHIWAAGTVHAFNPDQLNIGFLGENQLTRLSRLGLFKKAIPPQDPLPSPHDTRQSLESRARSYLAMNCSTCHRMQGGGTANFNFDITLSLQQNKFVDALPAQGTFGIADARVVASGDPYRSVMLYRALKSGRSHMPQFGSNVIDIQGLRLLRDWILSMPSNNPPRSDEAAKIANLLDSDHLEQDLHAMLQSTSGAMALSFACSDGVLSDNARIQSIELGSTHGSPEIRDLFEHYLPEDQRIKRLGPSIDEQALLNIVGSVDRGRELFENAKDMNCKLCHRIGDVGQTVGPDLSGAGVKQSRAEILASLLRPSEKIDVKYRSRKLLTVDGEVIVGIVTDESGKQLMIADASGKVRTILVDQIEAMQTSTKSVMPDQLLAGMTAQQAADLLAYLWAQKKTVPGQELGTGSDLD